MQTTVKYYSRSNVGSKNFDNDFLLKIAEEIQSIIEEYRDSSVALEEVEEFLDEYEWNTGQGYTINYDEGKIILYDKKIQQGCSYGYDEITIVLQDEEPANSPIIRGLRELAEKLKDDANYRVTSSSNFKDDASPLVGIYQNLLNYLNEDEEFDELILSGQEVKKLIIQPWIETVLEINEDEDYYGYAWGEEVNTIPVCAQNPYASAGDCWDWNGDEKEFSITVQFTSLVGAHYHVFEETITIERIEED